MYALTALQENQTGDGRLLMRICWPYDASKPHLLMTRLSTGYSNSDPNQEGIATSRTREVVPDLDDGSPLPAVHDCLGLYQG